MIMKRGAIMSIRKQLNMTQEELANKIGTKNLI